jgi:hypothetical protein
MAKGGSLSGVCGGLPDHNEVKTFDNQGNATQAGDVVNGEP